MHTTFKKYILQLIFLVFFSLTACEKPNTDNTQDNPVSDHPDQYDKPFAKVPEVSDIVMYEINQRAFSVQGNLSGILPRLDSIKALGVNVIWLMPIHPIGSVNSVNSPYSVKNFLEVNPEFGTLEDLRMLVKEAHQRDMAVILDWVANHTSWDNPWIVNKSWYTQDGNGNIIHPAGTNWLDVADLNFTNAEMRLEMIKALQYWVLQANVDGYRCDAADWVPYSFWKQAIDTLKKIPNRKLIMLAEGDRKDHFDAGFHLNFGWDFFSKTKSVFKNNQSVSQLTQSHQNEYSGLTANKHRLRFTSNHDECAWDDTPLGLFGGKNGSMAAFVITTFMGGVPLIYNGQEVGCPVKLPFFSKSPINWATNPDMFTAYKKWMSIRKNSPAARYGTTEVLPTTNDVLTFRRVSGSNELLVFVNVRNSPKSFSLPQTIAVAGWKDAMTGENVTLETQQNLQAYAYKILVK
jgi:glycosidase